MVHTVLDHLPPVTGSEKNMCVYVTLSAYYGLNYRRNSEYQHRTGVIPRKVEWEYYPEAKANIFEGLSTNTFLAFKSFIKENDKEQNGTKLK